MQDPTEDMNQEVLIETLQKDELKESLNQLIIQSKKQQNMAAVLEIQKDYQKKFDNIPISISDQSTPVGTPLHVTWQKKGECDHDTSNIHFNTASQTSKAHQIILVTLES